MIGPWPPRWGRSPTWGRTRPSKGPYRNSSHIFLDWAPAPKGSVSKLKPYPPGPRYGGVARHGDVPGPHGDRIETQAISSLTGPRSPKAAYQNSSHILPAPDMGPYRTLRDNRSLKYNSSRISMIYICLCLSLPGHQRTIATNTHP